MVAVAHVSNVLGTINPIAEIARLAHDAGALVVVDGAQAGPKLPLDMAELGADFYALTAHKMYGPTGIGALYGRRELLEEMPPFIGGGSMIRQVRRDEITWAELPAKFEGGTPAIGEAIGYAAAVEWLDALGLDAAHAARGSSSAPTRSSAWPRFRGCGCSARPRATTGPGSSPSPSTASTPTTSRRSSTATRSASAPATTAPRSSWTASACRRPPAPAWPSTTRAQEVDRLVEALHDVRRVFELD